MFETICSYPERGAADAIREYLCTENNIEISQECIMDINSVGAVTSPLPAVGWQLILANDRCNPLTQNLEDFWSRTLERETHFAHVPFRGADRPLAITEGNRYSGSRSLAGDSHTQGRRC